MTFVLTSTFLLEGAYAGVTSALQPFTLHDDFNGSTLSQWASYPPVQDVGYDPSLSPTNKYGAPGGRSLLRIVRPPGTGRLRFGFIKKVNFVAQGPVAVMFSYRLPIGGPALMEVALAGSDGHRYSKTISAVSGGWTTTRTQFRDIPALITLEAVYITATFSHGDPDLEYRFLLDNVSINAAQTAQFELENPKATAISPWTSQVAASTYESGQTIAISAKSSVKLTRAECVLKDQDHRIIVTSALSVTDGKWANASIYTVKESDPPGIWHAELHGLTPDGKQLITDVRLMVRSPRSDIHPRLYFDGRERSGLLSRTHAPGADMIWNRLSELATNSRRSGNIAEGAKTFGLLDSTFLLPTLPGYFDLLTRGSDRILYNALIGYVSGDKETMATAMSALTTVASWNSWTPPWFAAHGQSTYYPVGELTTVVAFAYDILYNDFSKVDRELIRRALIERGVKAAYDEYVLDNRIMAGTSNWIGHTVGGAIVASLVLLEHEDDPALNTYLGGLLMKFEDHLAASYLSDGSYGEGISYQEFDLKSTTLALTALKRVCGIDYWSRTYVKDSLLYPLYTLATPIAETLDTGDSHPPSGYSIAQVVQHSNQPTMRWYYDQFKHSSINDFLFPVAGVPAQTPSMPPSRIFPQKGNAVFRTGWSPDDAVLLFRAGPNFNHNHADQGSFLLRALGETFATEAGYSDYYKDPYYATYFSQAAGHNTVLVNGNPASQEIADTEQFEALHSYPRITDSITSNFYDAVGSDLTTVYKDQLKSYTRRIAFFKPRHVVVYDELATGGSPAAYDWLLHVNDRERIHAVGSDLVYQGEKAAMGVRVLQPETHKVEVKNGHIPFAVLNPTAPQNPPPMPGTLDIKTEAKTGSARFVVLLSLARSTQEAASSITAAKSISGDGCSGMRLDGNEILFRHSQSSIAHCGDWTTDASALTSAGPLLSAEQVTSLAKAGRIMLKSDHTLNFAARYGDGSIELVTSADKPTIIHLYTGFLPSQMEKTEYDSTQGTVTVRCPVGRAEFKLAK